MGNTKPDVFNLGDSNSPNSIRVYRNGQPIDYSATDGFQYNSVTNTIELFGTSRPNVGDTYSVKMVAFEPDLIKNDNKLEIPLVGNPEIYGEVAPTTLKVTIAGKTIDYDENKQNGFYYNRDIKRIEVYGDSRPDASDANNLTIPTIKVNYVTENTSILLYNNSYDLQIPSGASSYGLDEFNGTKGLIIYKNGQAIPYSQENGYTYDRESGRLSLHGDYRPTTLDAVGAYKIYSVPESSLSTNVPIGSTIHTVTMNGQLVLPAEDENGNGYIVENGKVHLVGDARPDAAYGTSNYKLDVLYTEPLSIELPVNPIKTGDNSYCDHEVGSALPDAELVADSQVIKLNGQPLSPEQYDIIDNRIVLRTNQVAIHAGTNTLSVDYEVRQGTNFQDNTFTFQVGGNEGNHKKLAITSFDNLLADMSPICVRTFEDATQGLAIIDRSMDFILRELGNIGAAENSFNHIAANLHVSEENLMSALSHIEDTDIAKELMNSTKLQMLAQVQQTLSGHAKQQSESVLKLLF